MMDNYNKELENYSLEIIKQKKKATKDYCGGVI